MNQTNINDSFLRLPEVLQIIPVCKTTWWAGVKDGRFPKGVKLSARVTVWPRSEIQALVPRLAKEQNPED